MAPVVTNLPPQLRRQRVSTTVALLIITVMMICCQTAPLVAADDNHQLECLKVANTEFVSSLKSTIDAVREVTSVVSKFTSSIGDFRLGNAINDCLDLLDLSADELSWTLSATQSANVRYVQPRQREQIPVSVAALLVSVMIVWCGALPFASATLIGGQPTYLNVANVKFEAKLKTTITAIREVYTLASKYTNGFGDFRLKGAIKDCMDLLDLSADEISWTLNVTQSTDGKDNSTGNLSGDMRTWLSGALGNQDTCSEGFQGTNSFVKAMVVTGLEQVNSLVRDVLVMVRPTGSSSEFSVDSKATFSIGSGNTPEGSSNNLITPQWIKPKDRKLIQGNVKKNGGGGKGSASEVVVALDGSGDFTSINDAINAAPDESPVRHVIYVKKGVYREYVEIGKKKHNIMLIGDGMDVTVVTGNHNFVDGWTTYHSSTFAVKGKGFIARDMTFENTAGPLKHQAVAFRSDSDLSVLYRCAIRGYQDSLYAHSMRQFYRDCVITGTVDFIFGNAAAVFQNCEIIARKGSPGQKNTITAQGRKEPAQNTGFSFQFVNITVEPEVLASLNTTYSYLGRPWKLYSRTIIMQSFISNAIRPEGWLEWDGNFALDTIYYGEFMNFGPGAGLNNRVKWPGFHAMTDSKEASNYTVAEFILGNAWLPPTGIKFTAGLAV